MILKFKLNPSLQKYSISFSLLFIFYCNLVLSDKLDSVEEANSGFIFQNEMEALSYALGFDKGKEAVPYINQLKDIGILLNIDFAKKGFRDSQTYHQDRYENSKLSFNKMKELLYALDKDIRDKTQALARLEAAENKEKSKAYLQKNAFEKSVVTLASGLQIKIIKNGQGETPTYYDLVTIKSKGRLIDGTTIDKQSIDCLSSVKVTSLIAGLTEAVLKMKVGDRWEVTIPPDLAYGPSKHGVIPANSVLIYQLELVSIH